MNATGDSVMNGTGRWNSEQGAVLVMVLIVLVAAAVIGIATMRSTLVETRIAGNERAYQQTFYAADAAGEVTISRFDPILSSMSLQKDVPVDISTSVNEANPLQSADVTITFTRKGTPPDNSGTSAANSFANYYVISSTINGETVSHGVWKAFPKVD
jgi:hypothetical protein